MLNTEHQADGERSRRRAYRAELARADFEREARGAENLKKFIEWAADSRLMKLRDVPSTWLRWVRQERAPADSYELCEAWKEEDECGFRGRGLIDHPMALTSPQLRLFVTEVYDGGSSIERWERELRAACDRAGLDVLFWPKAFGFWNPPSCHTAIMWKRGLWTPPTAGAIVS